MSLLGPQLDAFLAVVKHKTMHAASDVLCITQTAVTQRIQALEQRLKTTLFVRTRQGMLLTSEGEALLHYCQAAQSLEGEALAKIHGVAIEQTVCLRIAAPSSMMLSRVIPALSALTTAFPQLVFEFQIDDSQQNSEQRLRQGQADFAVLPAHQVAKAMCSKPLAPERYGMVAGQSFKQQSTLAIIQSQRIVDFDPLDDMTFNYLRHFDLMNNCLPQRHFVNNIQALADLVVRGLGYSVLTQEIAQPFIDNQQMIWLNQGKTYQQDVCLAWYDRPQPPQYFSAVIAGVF